MICTDKKFIKKSSKEHTHTHTAIIKVETKISKQTNSRYIMAKREPQEKVKSNKT